MNKRKISQTKKWIHGSIFCSLAALLLAGGFWLSQTESKKDIEKIEASTVVTAGDFRLTANNKWDNTAKRNYAQLDWDDIPNLTQSGYKLYQSEDGSTWENRSLSYGKSIKVLNVYPDITESNTLKGWMDGLGLKASDNSNLIQVTPVSISNFNSNPDSYLKNAQGEYQYDVIMFGSWDWNNGLDISLAVVDKLQEFINAGRGVLFGHDTITGAIHRTTGHEQENFCKFANQLGINVPRSRSDNIIVAIQSSKVKVNSDGYLLKYPFEFPIGMELDIPGTHTYNQSIPTNSSAIKWISFMEPYITNINSSGEDGNYYLITNNNLGMIQTGHSNGQSSDDERKIIANTLYNLAQVSVDNDAADYSVNDDKAPDKPEAIIRCGNDNNLNLKIDAKDKGKEYQFYVEADTRDQGPLQSDVVKESITSNIAGYFYEVTDSSTSNLAARVEGLKDEYGRIDPNDYDLYVAPDNDSVDYDTIAMTTISEKNTSGKYVHILAVDRANNVSAVSSEQIKNLVQPIDFEIERTEDEAKIVELALDSSIENKMKSIELQIPKNTEIKDFSSLTLPTDWYSFENSETADYYSFSFAMADNNTLAIIQNFLESLRFTIKNPVNDLGNIKIILHDKIYTSWIDGNGVTHYYVFMPEMTDPGKNWFEAYNSAKRLTYKGLRGYLATITSEEEHNFIFDNIAKEPGLLGGTRGVLSNGNKINDEKTVPQKNSDYDINQDEWYWANGPETGSVFYIGKRQADGGYTPLNAYSCFTITEPNNNVDREFILQFAQGGTKNWNDLPGDLNYHATLNLGYYVEFSEYGDQVEGEDPSDLCWSAAIPQKISLKAYDESGGALTRGDLLYDQELRIGKAITVQPKSLEFYEFIEAREINDTPRGLDYTVSNTYQEGKLIYSLRKALLHVRQVILEPQDELVVPKKGYVTMQNRLYSSGSPSVDQDYKVHAVVSSGKQADNPSFTKMALSTKPLGNVLDEVVFNDITPEFYEYVGYYMTDEATDSQGASHNGNTAVTAGNLVIDRGTVDTKEEFWITLYLKPTEDGQGEAKAPQPYSWDYKKNDLGKIKTK